MHYMDFLSIRKTRALFVYGHRGPFQQRS